MACSLIKEFQCLLDSDLYLPEDWANDPERRRKAYIPDEVEFRTKPKIAQDQVTRALEHGVRVAAWTFDELYGRDSKFLDFPELRKGRAFVGEVPAKFHGWLRAPKVLRKPPKNAKRGSQPNKVSAYRPQIGRV